MKDKNYYTQVFLEKYKYVFREKKFSNFIIDDIEVYSDDSGDSDEESSDEKICIKSK